MWRVWRTARAAYNRRPNQEWRVALGSARGNTHLEAHHLPAQSRETSLNTLSTSCFPEQSGLSPETSCPAAEPIIRTGESFHRGFGTSAREFSGAACAHCLCGRPHSCRAFSSQPGDESPAGDDSPTEAAVQDEGNVSAEDDDDDDEGVPDKDTASSEGPKSKSGTREFRKRGDTVMVKKLWAKLATLPQMNSEQIRSEMKKWTVEGNQVRKPEVVTVIRRCTKQGRYRQALGLSHWVEDEFPEQQGDKSTAGRIQLLSKMRKLKEAEEFFENAKEKAEASYNALQAAYVVADNVVKAESFFETRKKEGVADTAYPFNQMLLLYKKRNQPGKLTAVLEDMKSRGVPFDSYTYNILVGLEGKAGNIDKVGELYEQMKADPGIALDAATCATLASAYAEAGQADKVLEFLKLLGHVPFPKKQPAYETLIKVFAGMGKQEYVEKVWEMVKRSPVVAIQSYTSMIEAYGRLGIAEKSQEIFAEMEKARGLHLPSQYNALLSVYVKSSDNMDKAEEVLESMKAKGINRNALTYHILVSNYLLHGQMDKAAEALKSVNTSAKRSKTVPWYDTLYLMLAAHAEKGDIVSAEKQFQEIKQVYRRASVKSYNGLLSAYVTARQHPGGFLERMEADSIVPNDETRSLLDKVKSGVEPSEDTQVAASE
eukprot:TRINITY_DN4303_c0_g1_i1.p1 TRINITY_DN4303_c0_g1~~TRINITY_DN4303_c0_g1_i1.p1  ORF type:complete len:657 (-),score=115.65 TRINITY_DN4303_c0_g1_i1:568-2538(-)